MDEKKIDRIVRLLEVTDKDAIHAARELVTWHHQFPGELTRMRTPAGDAIVVVATGESKACLEAWYEEHAGAKVRNLKVDENDA